MNFLTPRIILALEMSFPHVERGEQERRLRERAEAADAALLALRAELDKTVWCLHHMCLHISLFVFVMCLFIISVFIISDQQ